MKIAFFTYLPLEGGGGVATYFIQTAKALKHIDKTLDITIVTFDESFAKKLLFFYSVYFQKKQDTNFRKESSQKLHTELKGITYINVKGLRELVSILYTQNRIYSTNNLLEVIILKLFNMIKRLPKVIIGFHIPLVYRKTSSLSSKLHNVLYASPLYYFALQYVCAFHVINSHDEKLLSNRFPKQKIHKIYNPINISRTTRRSHSALRILWVGRLTQQKGITDLANIITSLKDKKAIHWTVTGEGELKEIIMALTRKYKNIEYIGYVPHEKMSSLYLKNDLYIMTSQWESLPYTLLEAQAHGLPAIAYNIPGCQDIITQGKTGYLAKDTESFIRYVKAYKKSQFGVTSIQKSTNERFNFEKLNKKIYNLIANL